MYFTEHPLAYALRAATTFARVRLARLTSYAVTSSRSGHESSVYDLAIQSSDNGSADEPSARPTSLFAGGFN